jgi:hypothetical protein
VHLALMLECGRRTRPVNSLVDDRVDQIHPGEAPEIVVGGGD